MVRIFDFTLSAVGLLVTSPLFVVLMVAGVCDTGSPLFRQTRVGRNKKPFTLLKFRTMRREVVHVATHLVDPTSVTSLGRFLRRTKLDELPQLWNVLCGEMSLVGPRPCLFNQETLIRARDLLGVFKVRPGITGLAQITDIDMSTPELLAKTDAKMLESFGCAAYLYYLIATLSGKGFGDRIIRYKRNGCSEKLE